MASSGSSQFGLEGEFIQENLGYKLEVCSLKDVDSSGREGPAVCSILLAAEVKRRPSALKS